MATINESDLDDVMLYLNKYIVGVEIIENSGNRYLRMKIKDDSDDTIKNADIQLTT